MASDELKIVLEDVREKFDTVIEGINMVKETLDRHMEENTEEYEELRNGHDELKKEIMLLRKDLNDHRNNTELHAGTRRKKA
jgi:hypothetical protein